MLALPTLLSTLQGAALLAGRSMPPVRCSLASGGEAFLVPDASVPCVVFEDDQIAIVAKAGVATATATAHGAVRDLGYGQPIIKALASNAPTIGSLVSEAPQIETLTNNHPEGTIT